MVGREFIDIMQRIGLGQITAPKTFRQSFAMILQDANGDPLVRNELMGHVPAGLSTPGGGLAMTAVYTHTRPETTRRQLETAITDRPAVQEAQRRLVEMRWEVRQVAQSSARPDNERFDVFKDLASSGWALRCLVFV